MRKLDVRLRRSSADEIVVGQLAEAERRVYFEYDPQFLDRGLQLSPFKLPLQAGLIEHVDRSFGMLPGLFDDSLPDGWGLLLMDRALRRRGNDPAAASPLDRLAYLGTRTMGALTYHPPEEIERDDRLLDLEALGKNAQEVYSGEAVEVLPALLRAGGSPGGARPKILVGLKGKQIISGEDDLPAGFEHWIVKFSAWADARDAGPIEYAYALMARAAGIDMPPVVLLHASRARHYFAVKRFDRIEGNRRVHVHTFGNVIQTNFRIPSTDYADLLKVTSALTRNHADVLQVFRRMAFNVVTHNRDDHAKNFAFMMNDTGEWSLSPAYDLTYSNGPGGEHMMTVAGEGSAPVRSHLMQLATQSGILAADATGIIDQVNEAAKTWLSAAEQAGCTQKAARQIARAIHPI
ncbi:MAG: HipA-like protein [Phycisphaerales bacterium]|nr:HipA-like protein [Phycisphaerales bacterium]